MTYEPTSFQIPEPYYTILFDAMPGRSILVKADSPTFTILAATPAYVNQTNYSKEAIIGKGVFEAFPVSKDYPTEGNIFYSSYQHVLTHKEPHYLPVQRYDLKNADGSFYEKYWRISNTPVFSPEGEVAYIIHTSEDITDQVKTEKRREATNGMEKAYHLFMNAPVIIGVLKGDDYVIELANEGLLEVWSRTEEVIGKPLLTALPELEAQGFVSLMDQVRTTGSPFYANEFPIRLNRNGKEEVLYFDFVYKPYYDVDSRSLASGIISVGHDVTVQVNARKAAQESQAKYRNLFESMDQGFCVIEIIFDSANIPVDYRFVEANAVFEQQTGLQKAIGKTAKELIPNLETHWFELYGRVAQTGEAIRFTEGSEAMGRWFDVYAFRIEEGQGKNVALLFTDISEKKKAEEALRYSENNLRNMILQAPLAMAILKGPSFVVEIANDRMYELWGREKEQIINRSIFVGLPEVKDQGYEELLMGVYTTGKTFSALGIPVTLPRNEGIETVYINLLYEAFREADGTVSGIMAVATDVTEQVLATQRIEEVVAERTKELARANEELKRSNQNLEEFAYAASHDLKEPMRKIQLFSDRLKTSLHEKMTLHDQNLFDRIIQATIRMNTLIDDLLMYSHMSRGALLEENVDLTQKVGRVLEDLEVEIEETKAVITVEPLPVIKGHRRQLQQLFQNLIGNAIKYHKPGVPPKVYIRCSKDISEESITMVTVKPIDHYYLITVQDNGIGFEKEDAERIFHVFTRLHGNAEYKGTGVGLSIAQKVVENHSGYIWAESSPGEGSTFKVLLPAE